MKITESWLRNKSACSDGIEWFLEQKEMDGSGLEIVRKLMKENRLSWANWLIVRIMDYKKYVSYAVYAAERVIDIFEKKYPDNKKPREAIKAAKKCITEPTKKNRDAAHAAADASADYAAYNAADAVASAAYAAHAADYAAHAAADYAADAADYAADYAAYATAHADYAGAKMKIIILEYGIKLLEKELCDKKVIKQKISKMREIKFRVWDGNNRKFDYPDTIVLSEGLELQQFSGLIDKKGKEIYEGDIVKHYGEVWQVVFEDAMFIIKGLSYRTNPRNGESHKIRNDLLSNEVKVLEIIGNIYENKNLLEKRKNK